MTDLADAEEAIIQRLKTAWGATTPLALPGETFAEQNETWISIEVRSANRAQISVGSPGGNLARGFGTIMIHVFVRKNSGRSVSRTHAKALAAIFEAESFSGVTCEVAVISGHGQGSEDGKWSRRTVSIPFDCDGTV